MIFNYIDCRGNKGSIDIIDTNQEDILKALPEKYHKDSIIKINREKNRLHTKTGGKINKRGVPNST